MNTSKKFKNFNTEFLSYKHTLEPQYAKIIKSQAQKVFVKLTGRGNAAKSY